MSIRNDFAVSAIRSLACSMKEGCPSWAAWSTLFGAASPPNLPVINQLCLDIRDLGGLTDQA
jgi:hypothetical protein